MEEVTSPLDNGNFSTRPSGLSERRSANSQSARLAAAFAQAVTGFFARAVGEEVDLAGRVVNQLGPTLSKCDELDFGELEQTLAYLLWHEVDRYHRVTQALDLLFEHGVLPIAKPDRDFRVLEVGSGPAPGSYATVHYFAALGEWTRRKSTGLLSSGSVEAHTLDRGPAWSRLVHQLSEELAALVRTERNPADGLPNVFYDVTYADLRGFNPRQLHNQSRDAYRQRLLEPSWDDDRFVDFDTSFGVSDRQEADILSAQTAPPSAYDLIIVANFVTNDEMLQALKPDIQVLARSLVPGGVLLTLSAPGKKYKLLWDQFSEIARRARLDHEVDEVLSAHRDPAVHAQVAGATITALRHLDRLKPNTLGAALLPDTIKAEVGAATSLHAGDPIETATTKFGPYPDFQVHAFKRGPRAITPKERRRISLRRARQGDDTSSA